MSLLLPIFSPGDHKREPATYMSHTWRIEAISSLARVVQDDPEPDQLASHIALNILTSLDCRAVALGVISTEGFLDLIGSYGLSKATTSPYIRMPLWAQLPMTETVRTGELIFIKSYDDFFTRFPDMVESIGYKDAITVASPIKHRGIVIGSIAFTSINPPSDDFRSNPMTDAALALIGMYMKNYLWRSAAAENNHLGEVKDLSARQREIIKLFRDGLTTEQMANRLRFSSSTIKQDIIKIYEIFGVNTREEVLALAERAGLLNSDKNS